jgi:hypothetical protein
MDIAVPMWIHGCMARSAPRTPEPRPTPPARRAHPEERRRLSGPALRTFFRIADAWGLDVDAQRALLGWPSRSAFYNWRSGAATLPYDTLVRLSLVLGIYKALHVLYPDDEFADGWVRMRNTNALFGDRSPLEVMVQGDVGTLYAVRRLLDGRRGGDVT